jgi:hypothetical protein
MERHCSTGQSPQRAVAPTEEEEEEKEEEEEEAFYVSRHAVGKNILTYVITSRY